MDATPESFAYRCLPLNIANSHGWELLSPCGFEAVWNGGSDAADVTIVVDEGADPADVPVSLFGQGSITFHVAGLFRTPPGWNLWVGGPPNMGKDGIAPLNGIIETDWSPYTFTMNWRFTRPGQPVRFEENEPFCQIFPVERAVIESVEPRFLPIDDAPDLKRQFERWSHSRDAFQAEVVANPPELPSAKWQKLYYRGVDADGASVIDDHQSKLRLKKFAGMPEREDGFCPARPQPSPSVDEGDLALRKREWLLQTQERMRSLSVHASGIFRKLGLNREEFLDEHYAPGRPVIIGDAMEDWPARALWNVDYVRERMGSRSVVVQGDRTSNPDYERFKDAHSRTMPFNTFMDDIIGEGMGNDLYLTAYNSAANVDALSVLRPDIGEVDVALEQGSAASNGMLWIGPGGTFTPLHHDLTNNLILQIVGRKQIVLASPAETGRLYNDQHVFSRIGDVMAPGFDWDRYPMARTVKWHVIDLEPGDALFIPIGWWHQVRALDFSISMTCTSFLWANDSYSTYPSQS
jgi:hypothetical protein